MYEVHSSYKNHISLASYSFFPFVVHTVKTGQPTDIAVPKSGVLMSEEERMTGSVEARTYLDYFQAAGYIISLLAIGGYIVRQGENLHIITKKHLTNSHIENCRL